VSWDDGIIPDTSLQTDPGIRMTLNEVFKLAHPGGISGGPLFRLRTRRPKQEVWAPEKNARIVGVASTFLDNREYCPSVSAWSDWFRDTVHQIDGA